MDFNKKLAALSPVEFENYFNSFPFEAHGLKKKDHNWKKEYRKIGGKIKPVENVPGVS